MNLKEKIISIAYRIKDHFSGKVGKVVNSVKKVDDETKRAAKNIKKSTNDIQKSFSSLKGIAGGFIGSLSIGTAFHGLKNVADDIDQIGKASDKLGISVENLSKLEYAARIAAVPFKQLEVGIQRMVRRLSEVANTGKGVAQSALARLGLDAQKLIKLAPEEQLKVILTQLHKLDNQSEKIELAQKLFDSEGVNLIRLSADAIDRYGDELEKLGAVITSQDAEAAARFNDNLERLDANISALGRSQINPAIDKLNKLFEVFGAEADRTPLQKLNDQIREVEDSIRKLQDIKAGGGGFLGFLGRLKDSDGSSLNAHIEKLTKRLLELQEKADDLKNKHKDGLLGPVAAATLNDTSKLEESLKTQAKLFHDFNDQLIEAKKQQKSIAEEFADAFEFASTGKKPEEEKPTFQDLSDTYRESKSFLDDKNYDAAIKKAREANSIIEKMFEGGSRSDAYFSSIAKELENIANTAADAKTKAAEKSFESTEQVILDLSNRIATADMKIESLDVTDAANQAADSIQSELQSRNFKINVDAVLTQQDFNKRSDRYFREKSIRSGSKR